MESSLLDRFISGKSFTQPPKPELLREYVAKHFPNYEVTTAYEAGCCGYYAHRCFESYGWKSLVVNPADIHRKGKEKYTKTDKIDAQLISRELKEGRLDSIEIPDIKTEQLRSLFRRRNDLVKDYRRIKSYIKMQLLYFGVSIPEELIMIIGVITFGLVRCSCFRIPNSQETLDSRMRMFRFIDKELRDCIDKATGVL